MRGGNLGDWKSLVETGGVSELRIHHGEGWRVYFGRDGNELVILLGGGPKSNQMKGVCAATGYWTDYKVRKKEQL